MGTTLTKKEMVNILCNCCDAEGIDYGSKESAKRVYDHLFEILAQELTVGTSIKLSGIGTLYLKAQPARKGRNPRTGEVLEIKERNVIKFKQSETMKKKLT